MDDPPTVWEFMDRMAVIENELMIERQVKQDLQGRLVSGDTPSPLPILLRSLVPIPEDHPLVLNCASLPQF
jgi:hypothetical protein